MRWFEFDCNQNFADGFDLNQIKFDSNQIFADF